MAEHQAPKNYTPEFCTSVYDRMHFALEAAVNAFSLASSGQKDLTRQAIKQLETSFSKTEKALKENKTDNQKQVETHNADHEKHDLAHKFVHEKLEKKLNKMKIQFYASGITALVFLIGFAFAIFRLIQPIPGPGPG